MRKSRITTEQIIGFIKQAGAGMAISKLDRRHGCRYFGCSPGELLVLVDEETDGHDEGSPRS